MIKEIAYANIALIKYWGKENKNPLKPSTSSISVRLKSFKTTTYLEKNLLQDEIYINDELQLNDDKNKIVNYLKLLKQDNSYFTIKSYNSFNTAAGLSSSSSGICALTKAINQYYNNKYTLEEMIEISKLGSGSSCRSYTDGYTIFKTSGKVFNIESKMKLYMGAIIIDGNKKEISSRKAMEISKNTSKLFSKWVKFSKIDYRKALFYLRINDFKNLGKIVERNFKLMHKTTVYSDLKFTYIKKESLQVLNELEKLKYKLNLFYTMDAGSNIKVFCLYKDKEKLEKNLKKLYEGKYKILLSEII